MEKAHEFTSGKICPWGKIKYFQQTYDGIGLRGMMACLELPHPGSNRRSFLWSALAPRIVKDKVVRKEIIRRITESVFKYGLGAAYIKGFAETKLVPLTEFVYRIGNFDVSVLAPVRAAIRYRLNKLIIGFRVDL